MRIWPISSEYRLRIIAVAAVLFVVAVLVAGSFLGRGCNWR